jgi:hypothetical protein
MSLLRSRACIGCPQVAGSFANASIRVLSMRAFIRVAVEIGMVNGISDR